MNARATTSAQDVRQNLSYGPVALVTGASDGIGRAFAHDLARRGYDVVLVARRIEILENLAADIRARHQVAVDIIPADLGKADEVERVLRELERFDLGLFVAAAGFGTSGAFTEQPLAPELDMIDVNCRAVVAMTHVLARRLVVRKRGGIVLLSSLVAFQGVPLAANYAATKAFIQSLVEGLRPELKIHGVDIIACAPGPVASGFGKRANMVMGKAESPDVVARETIDKLGRKSVVRPGRLAKLLEAAFTGMPRWGRVRIMTLVMKGMARGAENHA